MRKNSNILKNITNIEKKLLNICSKKWFKNPVGISAIDLVDDLLLSNEKIIKIMEKLVLQGFGTINKNVELYHIFFDFESSVASTKSKIISHIFFPSKNVLTYFFYKSKLSKKNIPEYRKRLHLGECQKELIFFKEEVLNKYFNHPEIYNICDSMPAGNICTNSNAKDDEYINVRYGKKKIDNGYTAIAAILKDLAIMNINEQKYWNSYEINEYILDKDDENFKKFLERCFEGKCVNYLDPVGDIKNLIVKFNKLNTDMDLFRKNENIYLYPPVLNTNKALCDSCSELYKLIGPDNINQKIIKQYLMKYFNLSDSDFIHPESGRPLSTIQLFKTLEENIAQNSLVSRQIKIIQDYRTNADHKILDKEEQPDKYTKKFYEICNNYISSANILLDKFRLLINSDC